MNLYKVETTIFCVSQGIGNGKQGTENRKQKTGNGKQETENRKQKTGKSGDFAQRVHPSHHVETHYYACHRE
ncbi:hypothetical protein BK054_16945 [Myroides sp. ZB35]|nr:hypothetical protein BK054_16945 [Myroides sp. ZB35]